MVDADGNVAMIASAHDDNKDTAMSHTPRTPPLSAALGAFADAAQAGVDLDDAVGVDGAADGDDGVDLSLKKKKKKKPKADADGGDDGVDGDDAGAAGEEGALDLSLKKKKKKKLKEGEDEFAAKLKALDIEGKEEDAEGEEQDGDMHLGTGIWAHDNANPISYDLLLTRFFAQLAERNPDHASSGSRSFKIPPPQCMREGNKKTIFANIVDICKRMKRTEEHVTAYLFSELGTRYFHLEQGPQRCSGKLTI